MLTVLTRRNVRLRHLGFPSHTMNVDVTSSATRQHELHDTVPSNLACTLPNRRPTGAGLLSGASLREQIFPPSIRSPHPPFRPEPTASDRYFEKTVGARP